MYPYIILAIYLIIVLSILGFYVIFFMHIKNFRMYSRYITPVFRILIAVILLIALFGAVMILTGDNERKSLNRSFDTAS